jgi:hypothetical protein
LLLSTHEGRLFEHTLSSLTSWHIRVILFAAQAMGLEPSSGQWSLLTRIVLLSRCEVKGLLAFMGSSSRKNFNGMREVF